MYYVYVIKSLNNQRKYVGYTNDIKRRLKEHNTGHEGYTKLTRPFKLVWLEEYQTKKEALRREKFLKSGQGREWLKTKLNKGT